MLMNTLLLIHKSIRFIWKENKAYLFFTLLSIILDSVKAFPAMYLTAYSIDCLTGMVSFSYYQKIVASMLSIMFLTTILSLLTDNRLTCIKGKFYSDIHIRIDNICMNTDYSNIQTKAFQENKAFALAALERDCLDLFIQSLRKILSALLILSGVIYIISKSSLLILIALVISFGISLYNDYLNARHNFTDTQEEVEHRRKSSYIQRISSDFAFAKEIRMFNLKDRFHSRMDEVEQLLFRVREIRRKRRNSSAAVAYAADAILDVCMYLFYGYQVLVSKAIALGEFSLYINALRQLKSAVGDIIYTVTAFVVNTEHLDNFFSFIEQPVQIKVPANEAVSGATIRFENVCFRYPNAQQDTLKNINITINPGETLLIVGENGAGKSTFAKLLCGLYKPTQGRILFGETDITAYAPQDYMRHFAAVFQDYTLFAMSISENICAMHQPMPERLRDALVKVNMFDKVAATENVESTSLYRIFDENGVEFSGGEMQRLAIARAIYKDTPVLILDEPTAALDPLAEHEIFSSFARISKAQTTVFISHRMSSVQFCDKVAVFKDGEICEYGTHTELMDANGTYCELYNLQAELYNNQSGASRS